MHCEILGNGIHLVPENESEAVALKSFYEAAYKAQPPPSVQRIPLTTSRVAGHSIAADFRCDAWCHRLKDDGEGVQLFISLGANMAGSS